MIIKLIQLFGLKIVETGRLITTGEYSGISAFKHVYSNFDYSFKNEDEAKQILELIRYANVQKQKPLVREEFLFIAEHPKIAETILTMEPPKITIYRPYIEKKKEKQRKKEDEITKELLKKAI
ncbi:MAG: hypothetical protein ACTSR8_22635 [Promethearchaeota archaeon]